MMDVYLLAASITNPIQCIMVQSSPLQPHALTGFGASRSKLTDIEGQPTYTQVDLSLLQRHDIDAIDVCHIVLISLVPLI
jgi:hypothetical protein